MVTARELGVDLSCGIAVVIKSKPSSLLLPPGHLIHNSSVYTKYSYLRPKTNDLFEMRNIPDSLPHYTFL